MGFQGPGNRVILVDEAGNYAGGGGSTTGSVTAPGTSGTQAQAVQGITGGVPQNVQQVDGDIPSGSPFSTTASGVFATIDTTGYASMDLFVTSFGILTYVEEQASDGSNNWQALPVVYVPTWDSGNLARTYGNLTTGGLWRVGVGGKTIRLRTSGANATPTTVAVVKKAAPFTYPSTWVDGGSVTALIPASTGYTVNRTTGIGTAGTQVSAADATNKRVVRNIGSIACELVQALGNAYGTGHPLPAGESFTFDAAGRTTGAIFVAAASSGGAVSVMTY